MDRGAQQYQRYLAGEDGALVELIRDHKDGLILFLNRYVDNIYTAEELAEDTFFRLVTRRPGFTPQYSFKTWLYTIGRNLAMDYLKRAGRCRELSPEELARMHSEADDLERAHFRQERKITLHRALSALREEYSGVLYLKFFEELSNEEIAKIMNKNKRQVENLLYQAKRALKVQLEQEGFVYEEL